MTKLVDIGHNFFSRSSSVTLFLIAFTPRFIWWLLVFFTSGDFKLYDSEQFILLADNLCAEGEFSRSTSSPFFPDIARTPGYPLFLLPFRALGIPIYVVSLLQATLGAFIPVWIYRATQHWQLPNGWIVFLLLCLSPSLLLFSPIILSDSLFILLVAFCLLQLSKELNTKRLIVLGLVLGVMAVTRPIAQFLPLILLSYFWKLNIPRGQIGLFMVAFTLLPGSWMARNYYQFGTPRLSSMSTNNLLFYNGAAALASAESKPFTEVQHKLANEAKSLQDWDKEHATRRYLHYCRERALGIFKDHPKELAVNTAKSLAFYHIKPPRSYFDKAFGLGYAYDPVLGYSEQKEQTGLTTLANSSFTSLALAGIQFAINLFLLITGALGFFRLRRNAPLLAWLILALVCYFWFLSVFTMTDARFQLPGLLLLSLIASAGIGRKA